MRPLLPTIYAEARRRWLPSVWTVVTSVCVCCCAIAGGADSRPLRADEPPALLPDANFRMHEPRELLSDGHQRFLDAGSEIQLASWETADPGQDGSATSAATDPIGADPLSRIEWPESDTGVDAGATLRGLAEGAGLVLAIAVVGLWALRQWLVKRSTIPGAGRNLRRIDSLSLPQRCHVHLLDVQGRRVLVAIDPGGLKGVTVLPDSFDSLIEPPPDDAIPAGDDARRGVPAFAATTLA